MKIEYKHIMQGHLPILTILLWGMTACSGSDGGFSDRADQEMKLYASSEKLSGEGTFSDSVFFAKGNESGKYAEIWKGYIKEDGNTILTEPQYYPSDDSRIYLCGFAPEGKPHGEGQIAYSINGGQDILVTGEQNGCLTDMFWQEGKVFVFSHLLTQLRFRFQCDTMGKEKGWKLLSLFVEGIQSDVVLSLADKGLSFSGDKGTATVFDHTFGGERFPLDAEWVETAGMVMIQPGVTVGLTVVLEDSQGNLTRFADLPVSFHEADGYPAAGTSYLLSVMLRAGGTYSLSAQVSEWKKGNNGTGIID